MRNLQKIAGGAVAAALLLGGASLAFAQSTSSYNPSAQVVPATPNASTGTTGTTGTTATGSSSSTTGTGTTGTSGTGTPGVPNTGAGGDAAANLAILGVSAAVAVIGGAYIARRRALA